MRALAYAILAPLALVACLDVPGLLTPSDTSTTAAASTDAGTTTDASVVGGGCGVEPTTGQQLCVATTMCPTLVVDVQAMPHCGFRLRGNAVDLMCACGASLCSMGLFDTCTQAAKLLTSQTEAAVCAQVTDGRCLESTATVPTAAATQTSSSTSSTGGDPNDPCDRQCVKDCGGGAACAAVCSCN